MMNLPLKRTSMEPKVQFSPSQGELMQPNPDPWVDQASLGQPLDPIVLANVLREFKLIRGLNYEL